MGLFFLAVFFGVFYFNFRVFKYYREGKPKRRGLGVTSIDLQVWPGWCITYSAYLAALGGPFNAHHS